MKQLIDALRRSPHPLEVYGPRGGSAAWFIGRVAQSRAPLLALCAEEEEGRRLAADLKLFSDRPVIHYPDPEIPPYAPLRTDPATTAAGLAALYQVMSAREPFILVASIKSLTSKTIPPEQLGGLAELLIKGEETDPRQLAERLSAGGYEQVALVQEVGEYSIRGGIIDIFSPGQEYPLRLDFFGDTVESLRHFDPISQRSIGELDEVVLLPASDCLYPPANSPDHREMLTRFRRLEEAGEWRREESVRLRDCLTHRRPFTGDRFFLPLLQPAALFPLNYLPAETLIITVDHPRLCQSLELHGERVLANYREMVAATKPALAPEELFLAPGQLLEQLAERPGARLLPLSPAEPDQRQSFAIPTGNHVLLKQQIDLQRHEQGLLAPLARQIRDWLQQGEQVLLASRSPRHAARMAELLSQHQLDPVVVEHPPVAAEATATPAVPPRLLLVPQPLSSGFDLPAAKLHFLSETELFGERLSGTGRTRRQPPSEKIGTFDELNPGDLVVHRRHGIGAYQGLVPIELNGITNDYLKIRYRGDDKLFIPVDQINSVGKYKGLTDQEPNLDKLGDKSWLATRNRIKKAVWQVARELLNLYAKRKLAAGNRFSNPGELYHELEESFPFDETPGQLKAIGEVMDDLCSDRPMDRLVCGDVGYGKTEVAVRAAFKVVEDGAQVAVLVPTTVLAEQHAATFRERLAGFPLRVDSLNRFRSSGEQKKIVAELAAGRIDIIIGTHRLLSTDVRFKKLGLLIIDEEHRFGVTHKEKLKKLRTGVDVLTLTATPIPRTLQLSLLGVRDLSVISSPPKLRRTVKTFIARHDDLVIKEAVHRELGRDGQVFLVHNRVKSIHEVATRVQQLVPEARVAVAHGQMPAKQLEEIMVRFVRREINVLICTTIIESGLDIPSANTIIITQAERLGLAEIYQLRGRVGRSSQQAYAYLLVPALDDLAGEARRRLQALMDYNELGGGFKLALSDLQIRGGGNILGESQSGNIAAVGYDMYLDLLQKTVIDLKRRGAGSGVDPNLDELQEEVEPEIKLAIAAHIPQSYVSDVNQRYLCYRKITAAPDDTALADIRDEFSDRFGPLPPEADNLFAVIALKNRLAALKVSKLEQGPAALVFSFHASTPVPPERILTLVNQPKKGIRFTPEARLICPLPPKPSPAALFNEIKKLLHALMGDDISF
ncbi:MAG TPA: transcription-repair coupling factor [Desulfurivibrio alkaliphilus]|uniref:Transcription-repair-coupling factor n=1 Tax=Desulfurivibrio alkaliphilus TaxID=427923 RepID=A0A7C2XNL0_9BACT|nr:transcription-repair coupling factor [Desulfurivibrio alkaliphilus]